MEKNLMKVDEGVLALEGANGVFQLIEKEINVPPDLVYKIGRGEGGYYASLYDLIAREMGMQFADPETVYEDAYRVRIRLRTRYWNRFGKEIRDAEEYEVDCKLLYEKARYSWSEITGWVTKNGKQVPIKNEPKKVLVRDEQHPENPPKVIVTLPDSAEQELYENFLTLRRNKLAKAITCARRRLIQRAIGIKKFSFDPKDEEWNKQTLTFYAFLPAEADKKEGIQAIHDLTAEELPEKDEKNVNLPESEIEIPEKEEKLKTSEKEEKVSAKPAEKKSGTKKESKEKCVRCGEEVSLKVADFSKKNHKEVLCYDCQKK